MTLQVDLLERDKLEDILGHVAKLRIEVFREWPYLYDGDLSYERKYLAQFASSPNAVVVVARDGKNIVGASTASPLSDHHAEFARPFESAGLHLEEFFYLGESILLPAYRGRGVGVRFFELRERAAREQGFANIVFCAVVRPANHPLRPKDYQPLDGFWIKRGYRMLKGVTTHFPWKEIGAESESQHPMQFWMKTLVTSS